MKKYKIIALIGEAGSGKDFILSEVLRQDADSFSSKFSHIVNCTTRPPREEEKDGIHYHFLNKDEFTASVIKHKFIEWTKHRDWYYGTLISSLDKNRVNIGVFNPKAVKQLSEDERIDLRIYKIAAAPKTRLMRQLTREVNPDVNEIVRRYGADCEDFAKIQTLYKYKVLYNETPEDFWNNVRFLLLESLGEFD